MAIGTASLMEMYLKTKTPLLYEQIGTVGIVANNVGREGKHARQARIGVIVY